MSKMTAPREAALAESVDQMVQNVFAALDELGYLIVPKPDKHGGGDAAQETSALLLTFVLEKAGL